jgi:hypothetical protein
MVISREITYLCSTESSATLLVVIFFLEWTQYDQVTDACSFRVLLPQLWQKR